MGLTLRELTTDYLTLLDWMQDEDADTAMIDDAIQATLMNMGDKVDGYATMIEELKGRKATVKKEKDRLAKVEKRLDWAVNRMTSAIKASMEATGLKKIEGKLYTVRIVGNGGPQPMEICGDVPAAYTKVTVEPDTAKIRTALEGGEELDFARLLPRGSYVKVS